MSDRVKVSGYSQKIFYGNNIEWRPFAPDLVGVQLASNGGTPLFTMGNFSVTTNFDTKKNKNFATSSFSNFISLTDLDLSLEQAYSLLYNNAGVYLNLDKRNLTNYALFNSFAEYVRVGLENIISNWPAALYLTPIYVLAPNYITQSGYTVENYVYDTLTDQSSFKINVNTVNNPYQLNFLKSGSLANTFNATNDLRNVTINYASYSILFNNNEYDVIEFTGATYAINDYMYFVVKGNAFTGITTNGYLDYHIKPNKTKENLFFNGLDEFEAYLLNRLVYPKYTAQFNYIVKSDGGSVLYLSDTLTWPTTDGYNLDYDTDEYTDYAIKLLEISTNQDLSTSNLMVRFLVAESITDFDTTAVHLDPLDQDTSDQKVNKTLVIYGAEFDKINQFIKGIQFANTVTYDKQNNMPDIYLKNLARVLGWDLISSVLENDLLSSYVNPKPSTYQGQSVGLTLVEADIELWRRIILNTPWIWKSKGTRKSIEFLFKFIGTPLGLIQFNEYIYLAENKLDIDLFKKSLVLNGLPNDISTYPVSLSGYPAPLPNTSSLYYQNNGLWYRETGGDNASIDITSGNNPHVGPYDGGYTYINQFKELIPNFSSVTVSSSTTSTNSHNLFTNYNRGTMNAYTGNTYVDITTTNGVDFTNCYVVTSEIIDDPKYRQDQTNCGCDIPENLNSLSVCINKKIQTSRTCKDDVQMYSLVAPENTYYSFDYKQYNQDGSLYINNSNPIYRSSLFVAPECCSTIKGSSSFHYNETIGNGTVSTPFVVTNSGYICCSKGDISNTCGCFVTCKWKVNTTQRYIQDPNNLNNDYILFETETGEVRTTSQDGCNCIGRGYTNTVYLQSDPAIIGDTKGGYACQLTKTGLDDIINGSLIINTYSQRINGIIPCNGITKVNPVPSAKIIAVIINDIDQIGSVTNMISYQSVTHPNLFGNYTNYATPLSASSQTGAQVGYFAPLNTSAASPNYGDIVKMSIITGTTYSTNIINLPFDTKNNAKMGYLLSNTLYTNINFVTDALQNVNDITGNIFTEPAGIYTNYSANFNMVPTTDYLYMVFDYRKTTVIVETNSYSCYKYTNQTDKDKEIYWTDINNVQKTEMLAPNQSVNHCSKVGLQSGNLVKIENLNTTCTTDDTCNPKQPKIILNLIQLPYCKLNNCSDNNTCGVRYKIYTYNAPVNSYLTVTKNYGSANVSILNSNNPSTAELEYRENNQTEYISFTLYLNDSNGNIIASIDNYISHTSSMSTVGYCFGY